MSVRVAVSAVPIRGCNSDSVTVPSSFDVRDGYDYVHLIRLAVTVGRYHRYVVYVVLACILRGLEVGHRS